MNGPSVVRTPNCNHRAAPVEKGADPKSSDAVKSPLDTDTIRVTGLFVPTGLPPLAASHSVGAISAKPVKGAPFWLNRPW